MPGGFFSSLEKKQREKKRLAKNDSCRELERRDEEVKATGFPGGEERGAGACDMAERKTLVTGKIKEREWRAGKK